MTIETKYSWGDEVWFMKNDKPEKGMILYVYTTTAKDGLYNAPKTTVSYGFAYAHSLLEEKVFPSKEELLNSL